MMDDPKMILGNIDEVKRARFGDFMFRKPLPLHSVEEKIERDIKKESNLEPSKTRKNKVFIAIGSAKSGNFKSFETVSGPFFITRVWDGCNMTSFRKRMKKRK